MKNKTKSYGFFLLKMRKKCKEFLSACFLVDYFQEVNILFFYFKVLKSKNKRRIKLCSSFISKISLKKQLKKIIKQIF